MKISYAITVCDELNEIQKLINFLLKHKRNEDEIIILYDSNNGSKSVEEYLRSHSINNEFIWYEGKFKGNFADWKNELNSLCVGDFIFNIDADEIPNQFLLQNLPSILENSDAELIHVPRVNTVDGITQKHINKWGWKIDKFESRVEEKELDLSNPQDLDEYNLLKEYDLIIEETIMEKL